MGHPIISADAFRSKMKGSASLTGIPIRRVDPDGAALAKAFESVEKAGDGSVIFILSTATPDRSHDVVNQDGWVLESYRKNPVVLWAHDHGGPPIARSPNTYVDGKSRLVAESPIFAQQDENPFGAMIGKMVGANLLKTTSVGFIPLEWAWNEERGGGAIDFKRQELLEWSVVPVPANPEALIGGAKAKGIDLAPLLAWTSKALDEKREFPTFSRAELEVVHKGLAPVAVQVPAARKDGSDQTVCACEAGPLVKCQECGGHKRCAVSPDSKSVKESPGGQPPVHPHLCDCDAGVLAKCHECGGHVRVEVFAKAAPAAEEKRAEEELSPEALKAIGDAAAAEARRQIDQLMGRVS